MGRNLHADGRACKYYFTHTMRKFFLEHLDVAGRFLHITHMLSKNLHAETIRLLRGRPKSLTLRQIAEDTELGEEWIKSVLHEKTEDPGVNKIQKLYEYLLRAVAA